MCQEAHPDGPRAVTPQSLSSTGPFRSRRNVWPAERLLRCSTCLTSGSSTFWGQTPGKLQTGSSRQMSTDPQVLGPVLSCFRVRWNSLGTGTRGRQVAYCSSPGLTILRPGPLCPVAHPNPGSSPLPPFLLSPSWTPSSFVHRRNAGPQYSEGGTCWHLNPVTPPHYHCAFPAWLPESKIHNA